MFRVGERLPIVVVSPQPWFPFQGWIRRFKPHFRPALPAREVSQGFEIHRPRFFSVPGILKSFDGFFMALGALQTVKKLARREGVDIIDAHFAYPDGYAATLIGAWLGIPATITLRGTEVPLARTGRRKHMVRALARTRWGFSVSDSLRRHVAELGADASKIEVIENGVDITRFFPIDKSQARSSLALPADAQVLISVGGLVERKGFHRVIECLPALLSDYPKLHYLVVGSGGAEGDYAAELKAMVNRLTLSDRVHFLGHIAPDQLRVPLSASDVFVLSTRNEGWANVFLEAMACGLPVVTTLVGGNSEVVNHDALGRLVPFGDASALRDALAEALRVEWDRPSIISYARQNSWDDRVDRLVTAFYRLLGRNTDSSLREMNARTRTCVPSCE